MTTRRRGRKDPERPAFLRAVRHLRATRRREDGVLRATVAGLWSRA
jgi:hypothetical protein